MSALIVIARGAPPALMRLHTSPFKTDMGILRDVISKLKPGEYFLWHRDEQPVRRSARQVGVRVRVEKQNGWFKVSNVPTPP